MACRQVSEGLMEEEAVSQGSEDSWAAWMEGEKGRIPGEGKEYELTETISALHHKGCASPKSLAQG